LGGCGLLGFWRRFPPPPVPPNFGRCIEEGGRGRRRPSKSLRERVSVEPVRPKPHSDHDDNQQGAADPPPPRDQSELANLPRRLTVAIICLMGRARIGAYLPSKYMKTTKATTTSAQSSNCESSMEFPQSRENARPVSKVQSINRRVSHVPYHGLFWIIIGSQKI
jgi:hypothetical protein